MSGRASKRWCALFLVFSLLLSSGLFFATLAWFDVLEECVHVLACVRRGYSLSLLAQTFDYFTVFPSFLTCCLFVTTLVVVVPEALLSSRDRHDVFARLISLTAMAYVLVWLLLGVFLVISDFVEIPAFASPLEFVRRPYHFVLVWSLTSFAIGLLALIIHQFLRRSDCVWAFAMMPVVALLAIVVRAHRVWSALGWPAPDWYPGPVWVGGAVAVILAVYVVSWYGVKRLGLHAGIGHLALLSVAAWSWALFAFASLTFLWPYDMGLSRLEAEPVGDRIAKRLLLGFLPIWGLLIAVQVRRFLSRRRKRKTATAQPQAQSGSIKH